MVDCLEGVLFLQFLFLGCCIWITGTGTWCRCLFLRVVAHTLIVERSFNDGSGIEFISSFLTPTFLLLLFHDDSLLKQTPQMPFILFPPLLLLHLLTLGVHGIGLLTRKLVF